MRGEDLGRHLAQLARLERDRLAVRPDLVRVRARARARARARVRVRVRVRARARISRLCRLRRLHHRRSSRVRAWRRRAGEVKCTNPNPSPSPSPNPNQGGRGQMHQGGLRRD